MTEEEWVGGERDVPKAGSLPKCPHNQGIVLHSGPQCGWQRPEHLSHHLLIHTQGVHYQESGWESDLRLKPKNSDVEYRLPNDWTIASNICPLLCSRFGCRLLAGVSDLQPPMSER